MNSAQETATGCKTEMPRLIPGTLYTIKGLALNEAGRFYLSLPRCVYVRQEVLRSEEGRSWFAFGRVVNNGELSVYRTRIPIRGTSMNEGDVVTSAEGVYDVWINPQKDHKPLVESFLAEFLNLVRQKGSSDSYEQVGGVLIKNASYQRELEETKRLLEENQRELNGFYRSKDSAITLALMAHGLEGLVK
jgi:hypothetical protein